MNIRFARVLAAVSVGVLLSVVAIGGQAVITPPSNNYTTAQDVELGQKAAAEVEQQLPMLRDAEVTPFMASIGRRLVDAIPQELRHPECRYSFEAVLEPRARGRSARPLLGLRRHVPQSRGIDPDHGVRS